MFNLLMNTNTYLLYGHFRDVVLGVRMQILNEFIQYTQQVEKKETTKNVPLNVIC